VVGSRSVQDNAALESAYEQLIARLPPLVEKGLAAAVYTQLTDVEGELNGLLTYDRKVTKVNADRVARIHRQLIEVK